MNKCMSSGLMASGYLVLLTKVRHVRSIEFAGNPTVSAFPEAVRSTSCLSQLAKSLTGRILAAAFSDHVVHLIDAHSGKAAHQLDCSTHSLAQVCCLGWGLNFTDAESVQRRLQGLGDDVTLDDILSQTVQAYAPNLISDLPRDLASLDVEGALPKLSVLSSGAKE